MSTSTPTDADTCLGADCTGICGAASTDEMNAVECDAKGGSTCELATAALPVNATPPGSEQFSPTRSAGSCGGACGCGSGPEKVAQDKQASAKTLRRTRFIQRGAAAGCAGGVMGIVAAGHNRIPTPVALAGILVGIVGALGLAIMAPPTNRFTEFQQFKRRAAVVAAVACLLIAPMAMTWWGLGIISCLAAVIALAAAHAPEIDPQRDRVRVTAGSASKHQRGLTLCCQANPRCSTCPWA